VAVVLANSFDSGTNGAAIAALTSGGLAGDVFDNVAGSSGIAYSSTHPAHGGMGFQSSLAVTTNAQVQWDASFGSPSVFWGRFYLYLTSYPPLALLSIFDALIGGSSKWRLTLDNVGHVISRHGSTNASQSSTILALNTLYRLEFKIACSLTAEVSTIRIYAGDSATLLEENVGTSWAGEAAEDTYRLGLVSSSAPTWTAYFDDFALSDVDWIGPGPSKILASRWVGAINEDGATVAVQTSGVASARLKVSTAADLATSPVFSSAVVPDANGLAKLTISGLDPSVSYFYGVELDGTVDTRRTGRFKTLPPAGLQASYSFAAASCAKSGSNHAVFDAIRQKTGLYGSPLFFHHLGDLHYANVATNDQAGYRTAYARYLGQANPGRLHANIPTSYAWSDHDTGTDDHDGSEAGLPAAAATYRVQVPHHPLGATDSQGVYQSWVVGRVRFIATDGRSYRSPKAQTDDASKTMLGSVQKQWLKDRFAELEPVKVWLHEDPWVGAASVGADDWRGYNTERQELAAYVGLVGAQVFYIAGDMHVLAADDGTNSPGGFPVAQCAPLDQFTFFLGGPYSAGSYPTSTGPDANQYGWFDVTDAGSTITIAFTGYDSGGTARMALTKVFALPVRLNPAGPQEVGAITG
jgi:hypothetical protein